MSDRVGGGERGWDCKEKQEARKEGRKGRDGASTAANPRCGLCLMLQPSMAVAAQEEREQHSVLVMLRYSCQCCNRRRIWPPHAVLHSFSQARLPCLGPSPCQAPGACVKVVKIDEGTPASLTRRMEDLRAILLARLRAPAGEGAWVLNICIHM